MQLAPGELLGYNFDRMVVEFTMLIRTRLFCAQLAPRRWMILKAGVT